MTNRKISNEWGRPMKTAPLQFLILYGKTGCGKSEILRQINKRGEQLLDLEKLAIHNGSAFGGLGKNPQPSQDEFEKKIQEKLSGFNPKLPVWVEYESNYLGKLQIPDYLIQEMSRSKMIVIDLERQQRVLRIIEGYAQYSNKELSAAISKVKKKLSQKKYRRTRQAIRQQDFQSAVSVLLTYYDKVYENGRKNSKCELLGKLILTGKEVDQHANQLLDFYDTNPLKYENPE